MLVSDVLIHTHNLQPILLQVMMLKKNNSISFIHRFFYPTSGKVYRFIGASEQTGRYIKSSKSRNQRLSELARSLAKNQGGNSPRPQKIQQNFKKKTIYLKPRTENLTLGTFKKKNQRKTLDGHKTQQKPTYLQNNDILSQPSKEMSSTVPST